MLLREFFEAAGPSVDAAFAFGRFNPAHQGHIEVYKAVQAAGEQWFIGTNPNTHGPNDPLTFEEKAAWMQAIYPEIKGHILPEQSVVTLASKLYEMLGDGKTIAYVTDNDDWKWAGKLLNDYNGKEGPHGYYKFDAIRHVESPRVSSATALRTAARSNDETAFYAASGTNPKLTVNGKTYFDTVVAAVGANPEKPKKAVKKKEPVAAEGTMGVSKSKETEFHTKLDKLVHSVFGKREDEGVEETARMSAAVKLQRAFQRQQEKSAASRKRGEEVMAQAKADAEKKSKKQGVAEMDSQGYTGSRDRKRTSKYGSRDDYELGKGKEGTGKPLTAKQMMDKAHKAMMKSMSNDEKVDKGWRNPNLKEYGDTAKGQKMLTKVQKRAVDRVTSKKADTDPKYAKKNKDTADRAWDRMDTSEDTSKAIAQTAKRLTDPKDGATAKLRSAGDKRREDQLKGRDIAKRNESLNSQLASLTSEMLKEHDRYFTNK